MKTVIIFIMKANGLYKSSSGSKHTYFSERNILIKTQKRFENAPKPLLLLYFAVCRFNFPQFAIASIFLTIRSIGA